MAVAVPIILGVVAALVLSILTAVLVVPESKKEGLNGFFTFLHDLFNFKSLLIEKILKFFYILCTYSCITAGLFGFIYSLTRLGYQNERFNPLVYLLVIVIGPVAVRLVYEAAMLFILLVKNTIDINRKLDDKTEDL